jgi:hypothetical protein
MLDKNQNSFPKWENLNQYPWATTRDDIATLYFDGHLTKEQLKPYYYDYISKNKYLLFQKKMVPLDEKPTYKLLKASIRGNDVYRFRTRQRFKPLYETSMDLKNIKLIDQNKRYAKTRLIFATLTCNMCVHNDNKDKAWFSQPYLLNEFHTKLRKEYGKISILRTFESTEDGSPHVHEILYFQEHEFNSFRFVSDHGSKKGVIRYLLDDHTNETFQDLWFSQFVHLEAVQSFGAIPYLLKYITKEHYEQNGGQTAIDLWLYKQRSYAMSTARKNSSSVSFHQGIINYAQEVAGQLDTILRNSNRITPESYSDSDYCYVGSVVINEKTEFWKYIIDPPDNLSDFYNYDHDGRIIGSGDAESFLTSYFTKEILSFDTISKEEKQRENTKNRNLH